LKKIYFENRNNGRNGFRNLYLSPFYYLEEGSKKSSGNRYLENCNYIKHGFLSL